MFFRNNTFRNKSPQIPNPCGLINYWPFNGNYDDVIGGANLFGGQNFTLSGDRNGMTSSALELGSIGYLQAPSGVYFNGDFSVTCWFYLLATPLKNPRIFDFGNGSFLESILITYDINRIRLRVCKIPSACYDAGSTQNFTINTWYFIGLVLNDRNLTIYFNGVSSFDSFTNNFKPTNITRSNNYIGKSNSDSHLQVRQKIDDLKFFNRALNITEIALEIASNFNCNINMNNFLMFCI